MKPRATDDLSDVPGAAVPERSSGLLERPEDLSAYIPYLINRLTNRWNLDQNRDLGQHGINATMLRTLSVLKIFGTLTVNEIARYAIAEQSNASRTIDLMVEAGLVERQVAEGDQRRRAVALTRTGESLLKQLWPLMQENYARLVDGIDPRDLALCIAVLGKMIDNIGEKST